MRIGQEIQIPEVNDLPVGAVIRNLHTGSRFERIPGQVGWTDTWDNAGEGPADRRFRVNVYVIESLPEVQSLDQDEDEEERLPLDDLDLVQEWRDWAAGRSYYNQSIDAFRDWLETRVEEDDHGRLEDVVLCESCLRPDMRDEYTQVQGEEAYACGGCVTGYSECYSCDELAQEGNTTVDDDWICQHCSDYSYSYCETCEAYYRSGDGDEHDHENCSCESPKQMFRVRNDGDGPLSQDTRVTVALPAREISAVGIGAIRDHLLQWANMLYVHYSDDYIDYYNARALAFGIEESLGSKWQGKEGNYTKRLSRYAYNTYKLRVPPEVLSEIGNIARAHSAGVDHQIEVTRDLNLPPEAFAHEDSCWWQSYTPSRCTLKSNGGFALRTFSEEERSSYWTNDVTGRAWVLPLKVNDRGRLVPTFETENPAALVVFNGYGDLQNYTPARIMAHMYGWTYRKIGFSCEPMYINTGGYLIAPEELAKDYTDGSLHLAVEVHDHLYSQEQQEQATTQKELAHV